MLFSCQALGWNKEKFSIIGHSYGAVLGMTVKSLL
jgi:predicted alpha/beta superfamily hydrolase